MVQCLLGNCKVVRWIPVPKKQKQRKRNVRVLLAHMLLAYVLLARNQANELTVVARHAGKCSSVFRCPPAPSLRAVEEASGLGIYEVIAIDDVVPELCFLIPGITPACFSLFALFDADAQVWLPPNHILEVSGDTSQTLYFRMRWAKAPGRLARFLILLLCPLR